MISLDTDGFRTRTACPLCHEELFMAVGRPDFQRLYESPRGLVELTDTVESGRELVKCRGCGLIYNQMIPKSETLDFLYDVPVKSATWKFDGDKRLMREKLKFLEALPRDKPLRVLDVGCYTGGFLAMLPDNWIKYGLDPNSVALEAARERIPEGTFLQGHLEQCASLEGRFDLITLWDVAEHLDDADVAFERLARLLAPGGTLVLETGDADSRVAQAMGRGWYYVNCLEHFCVFSEDVLRRMLPKYGLEVSTCARTTHHRYHGKLALRSRLQFWGYYFATLGGRTPIAWRALCRAMQRNGASWPPAAADHILALARKV